MQLHFSKIARGPAWERWAILEDQLGDTALAGEVIITYTDIGAYADAECDVLFTRELSESEMEELLDEVYSVLTGRGSITVYTSHELVSQGYSLIDDELENPN